MKKLFKIIGYIFLMLLLLSGILLVSARFLAPTIVERFLTRDLEKHGYAAAVDVEMERLSPFGLDIPLLSVDLGGGELEILDMSLDVEALLSSSHELRISMGKLKVSLTDDFIGYLEGKGVQSEALSSLKGRNLSIDMVSPYMLAVGSEIYLEVNSLMLSFHDPLGIERMISTDGFKLTADTAETDFIVTPVKLNMHGAEILSFDEGIYSRGNDVLWLGHVTIPAVMGLPETRVCDMELRSLPEGIELTSSGMVISGIEEAGKLLEEVQTEAVYMLIGNDGRITIDTAIIFSGEDMLLNDLGLKFELTISEDGIEVRDGSIFHRKLRGRIPFQAALEGSIIEVEIAGSRRFVLDRDNPSESAISEMISFILMKFASSLFGLGKTHFL